MLQYFPCTSSHKTRAQQSACVDIFHKRDALAAFIPGLSRRLGGVITLSRGEVWIGSVAGGAQSSSADGCVEGRELGVMITVPSGGGGGCKRVTDLGCGSS